MTTYQTYGGPPDWTFLTKEGVTEAEAEALWKKHNSQQRLEGLYRAYKNARHEARNIGYERKSILGKMMYRWQWLVRQYA